MKTKCIQLFLALILTPLFCKTYTVKEYTFSTEFSKGRNDFYQGVLYDLDFNYNGSFSPHTNEDADLNGTKKVTLIHTFGFGRSYALSSRLRFTPTLNLHLTNKRIYHPSSEVISMHDHFVKFRTRTLGLSLKPSFEFPLKASGRKLSLRPQIGTSITGLGGSLDSTTFANVNGGFGVTYYRSLKKPLYSKNRLLYRSLTMGVIFSAVVHGDRSYGMIYGENLGLSISKIQYYPKHEVMFYISIGFRRDTPGSEKVKPAETQRKQNP